jgi:hypothetical protein
MVKVVKALREPHRRVWRHGKRQSIDIGYAIRLEILVAYETI